MGIGVAMRLRGAMRLGLSRASCWALLAASGACAAPPPAGWAVPLQVPGAPNLYRVSDTLYRGAQPTAAGLEALADRGVRTVVSLRAFHSDRDLLPDDRLGYERIAFKTWHPEEEDVVRFLRLATDPERTPVFVHCRHGSDRTGLMCAVYRVAVQGWSKQEAIRELREGGYGFHEVWENLPDWLEALPIERVRREAGLLPDGTRAGPERAAGPPAGSR